jgi:hypothetical protein
MSAHLKGMTQAQKAEIAINDYLIVKTGTAENEVTPAEDAEKPYGVAQVKEQLNPIVAGNTIEVAVYGGCYVRLGANTARGASVKANSVGKAIAGTSGDWCIGVLDEAGSTDDIVSMRIFIHKA